MTTFQRGQKVKCRHADGYAFTEGKEYTAVKFEPEFRDENFTWPAYLFVIDNNGREACCHATRFDAANKENT